MWLLHAKVNNIVNYCLRMRSKEWERELSHGNVDYCMGTSIIA
jgi:hypothetical protein